MYTVLSLGLTLLLALALTLLPFRAPAPAGKLIDFLRRRFIEGETCAALTRPAGNADGVAWLRLWGVVSGLGLLYLVFAQGAFKNEPQSVADVGVYALLASILGAVLVLVAVAVAAFLPRVRAAAALERSGILGLWFVDTRGPLPRGFGVALSSRIKDASCVGILDVTGFELLGRGPGASGGMVYDTLSALSGTPVEILLLEPEARVLDPTQKHATIFQTALAEMDVTPATYQRRLRATLDAVAALNEARAPEARIRVRFYTEKPAYRGLLLDNVALVGPWAPREGGDPQPLLEIESRVGSVSFHEAFRREFARMWSAASAEEKCEAAKKSATSVAKRQPVASTTSS